jgi:hypothetical protein
VNKDTILGIVRHVLTFGGGILVTKGILDAPGLDTAIGAVITLVGAVWSILEKRNREP